MMRHPRDLMVPVQLLRVHFWCTNMSCGGNPRRGALSPAAIAAASSSASRSTAGSHTHTVWSALDVASIALSNRAHSTLVIGPRWNEVRHGHVSRRPPGPALLWKF